MRLFKRKKKEQTIRHTDFSKYKLKITGKVMCAYEALTGRPFLKIETPEDIQYLYYCSLVLNNPEFATMEYDVFKYLMLDEEVVNWMTEEYLKIGKYLRQFKTDVGDFEEDDDEGKSHSKKEKDKVFYMLDAIPGLIVRMGMDPNYVMYEMEEWEITYYYRMMQEIDRGRLTEERLWTYLQILPHIGKKLGGPEKMLPFPWENSDKKKLKELNNNTAAAVAFLSRAKKTDGTKRPDSNPGQEGVESGTALVKPNE